MSILLYFLNVACASGQNTLGKLHASRGGSAHLFNINKAIAGILLFLIAGIINGISLHSATVLFGICYGVFLGISMYTGFKALSMGPMALTSIIASFSLVIPFIFGITVWREKLSVFGVMGILFLMSAIVLLNFKKEKGLSVKWSVFAMLTMVTNGICSLIQKYHQLCYPGEYRIEFMLWSLVCVLAVTSIMGRSELKAFCLNASGITSGILNSGANFIVLYLAATENASVLFPIVSVCNVITVWIIGRVIFKEKLKILQLAGLVLGVFAIILLNY